jgi:hypothetical protein
MPGLYKAMQARNFLMKTTNEALEAVQERIAKGFASPPTISVFPSALPLEIPYGQLKSRTTRKT